MRDIVGSSAVVENLSEKRILEYLTLRDFFEKSLYSRNYVPDEHYANAISLTLEGEELKNSIEKALPSASLSEIKLAMLLRFRNNTRIIDLESTDMVSLYGTLSREINQKDRLFPWVFDRTLYDKFYDMSVYHTHVEELQYEDTQALLNGTPQGVFQIMESIIGPYGIVKSYAERHLPPTLKPGLWHCPNPDCTTLHTVLLSRGTNRIEHAKRLVAKLAPNSHRLQVTGEIVDRYTGVNWYDDLHINQLPSLLANAFSERELRAILSDLIDRHSHDIRRNFPTVGIQKGVFQGDGGSICARMSKSECLQLILIMKDEDIVSSVESLIERDEIYIPPTETRISRFSYRVKQGISVACECSPLGIRSNSNHSNLPVLRLKRLINFLYADQAGQSQLSWTLRNLEGQNIQAKLDTYLATHDMTQVLTELVLNTYDHLQRTFEHLRYGNFPVPTNREQEESLVAKLLWKLGFDILSYPNRNKLLWDRMKRFLERATTDRPYTESDKERIRSEGVNFFVSLEEVLDHSLSFISWVLLSDHYINTKFRFNLESARVTMSHHLSGSQVGDTTIQYDSKGLNTLYPLIQGFKLLGKLCEDLLGQADESERPSAEYPSYYGHTDLFLFPFMHKKLILDIPPDDRRNVITLLNNITTALDKAAVCSVRNRIDHMRADFPTQHEIETTCDAIAQIIREMELKGICPMIYNVLGQEIDAFDRHFVTIEDFDSNRKTISNNSQYVRCGLPKYNGPVVLIPIIHIGSSGDVLRFQIDESSDYRAMWTDYPKKKRTRPTSQDDE